jgi:DNA (cytosine-5)-methyltransferase 1
MRSVELFAGAGGLALGVAAAGFRTEAIIENDKHSCATLRKNKSRRLKLTADWILYEDDISTFDFASLQPGFALLSGGPPCQPFSFAGHCRGHSDARNLFPEAIRAVRELEPQAFVIENVRGLSRAVLANYLSYICLQFGFPHVLRRKGERWTQHFTRLAKLQKRPGAEMLYQVSVQQVNAADYGVPQFRERIIIVGLRHTIHKKWNFPSPTHSRSSLLFSQWLSGEYWDRHAIANGRRPRLSKAQQESIARILGSDANISLKPWRTVRDGIGDLPDPTHPSSIAIPNHVYVSGARRYVGHSGSSLDAPAKTLKAGRHGVPGGENMIIKENGRVRYFTIRECARLQTFPDNYCFSGPWSSLMRQVGNAVPVDLSRAVAEQIRTFIKTS